MTDSFTLIGVMFSKSTKVRLLQRTFIIIILWTFAFLK